MGFGGMNMITFDLTWHEIAVWSIFLMASVFIMTILSRKLGLCCVRAPKRASSGHKSSRAAQIARGCLCATVIVAVLTAVSSSHWANTFVEYALIRSPPIHGFFQYGKDMTRMPPEKTLIVHQQLPRTAGDSMRTHLFGDPQTLVEWVPLWLKDEKSPPKPFTAKGSIERTKVVKLENENTTAVLKGFLSAVDLATIKREKLIYTFLRDPVERVLSFYNFFGEAPSPQLYFDLNSTWYAEKDTKKRQVHTMSYCNNAITYQLADSLHVEYRSLEPQDALAAAKRALSEMDYVGFYEDLPRHFWTIWEKFYSRSEIPLFFPAIFYFGTLVSMPRLRVKRFSLHADPEVIDRVRDLNDLDIELYEWARVKFDESYPIYDTYGEFVSDNILLLLLICACTLFVVFLLVQCLQRCQCGFCSLCYSLCSWCGRVLCCEGSCCRRREEEELPFQYLMNLPA